METKHTPTPWKAHQASDKYYYITGKLKADDVEMIGAPVECRLADVFDSTGADAKHIVKCVNSHEKLVEALRKVDVYFTACAKAWAVDDGKLIDSKGNAIAAAENLDVLCNIAARATQQALKSAGEI